VARTVRWTEVAIADLDEAAEYIARDSRYYAAALVRETRSAARSLHGFAERGRVVPEADSSLVREVYIKSYRLIYQIGVREVFILAFVHGARDLGALWAARKATDKEPDL
jgi:plasmid stabilization system protein ParE